jgi:beta-lactamase class A
VNRRSSFSTLRWISLALILAAAALVLLQLITFSRERAVFPKGQRIANVPVGGLDRNQAAQRLLQVYSMPVEIHYGDAIIQIKPSVAGFDMDLEGMLAAADLQRAGNNFWTDFWDYLWNRPPKVVDVPLRASTSKERLQNYLETEIAARYDQPPSPSIPVPASVNFQPGKPGTTLNIDRAVNLIDDALRSPTSRVVNLTIDTTSAPRPSIQNLEILLKQIIDLSKFDGLTEIYLHDLKTSQELHFAYQNGQNISVNPDIAFTAASTIKIPILVSIMRRLSEPIPEDISTLLTRIFVESDNAATDQVVMDVIDRVYGPKEVTQDIQALGLQNTFWAGFFYDGAPLLMTVQTPANRRTDINTNPDIYNQTTPSDIGMLLEDIYQCAQNGGGALIAVFGDQLNATKCQQMITYLESDQIGVLIQAGLPDGTKFAHKHGWVQESDGLIHTMGDAGIVFSPGGDYVLAIYLYQPTQLVFDPANHMVSQLSQAIYNYFNTSYSR